MDAGFEAGALFGSVIAMPLHQQMAAGEGQAHRVVIDLNFNYPDGVDAASGAVHEMLAQVTGRPAEECLDDRDAEISQYVVAELTGDAIRDLARMDREGAAGMAPNAIHRVWPDFEVHAMINKSASTVKASAARSAYDATGEGIVWAVIDSGIDAEHPHFATHDTLVVEAPIEHLDFTTGGKSPLTDEAGHGTHVAGIIAGEYSGRAKPKAFRAQRDHNGDIDYEKQDVAELAGMAPAARLVSYKVLNERGIGDTTAVIAALQAVQKVNNHGRDIKIHGVNLSVGYSFDPEWFACGQSPICVEVSRLVKSGVVVVVAAGNTGYGFHQDHAKGVIAAGMDLTINDPGNAELAITVGSTHRDMPYRYGVSYFSSKGPTGDGRAKPDLVAPGERILSCAAGKMRAEIEQKLGAGKVDYTEDSGTSMSAAHVSGVIAAFLSLRQEFVEQPEKVKQIFLDTATDLGRVPAFQGRGLVDLMRAIQSV